MNFADTIKCRWYADAIHQAGPALDNCWRFVDGTVRPVCRANENQRAIYNGHKRVHYIKFQSVALLNNGLVGNLFGPNKGRRHDSFMLAASGFLHDLQKFSNCPVTGLSICVYGDACKLNRSHQGRQLWRDAILDPRTLVFYRVTDGDKGSVKLHARVAKIWLQGSHSACSSFITIVTISSLGILLKN